MSDQNQHRYDQKKLAAIRAAAGEFAAHGYHGTSTKAIAERMGIKQGSLYYYFKSKQDALGEVCLYGIEDYVHRLETIASTKQPFAAQLLAVFQAHLSAYREKNEALKVYNDERLYLPEDARSELKKLGSGYRQMLESLFERAKTDGDLRRNVDCHFAAQAVIGMGNAWGDLIVRDSELDVFSLAQKCADMLMNGLAQQDGEQTPTNT
ncbi:MAG: TetR/AcrR family transcriptional regulator [Pseudomonadota bacterium]